MKYWPLYLGCVLSVIGRFLVPGHDLSWAGTYEAFVHLFVGFALGVWWIKREQVYLWTIGGITALEVVMSLLR